METKSSKLSFYVSALLFLAMALGLAIPMQTVRAATITVCASGCDYTTIQAAINAAIAGDTINVAAGTYGGQIIVNKSVTILGDPGDASAGPGPSAPIIDGGSAPGDAFLIANGVSNVTIQGFEMRNFTSNTSGVGNGISAWEASTSNITIQDNYFHDLGWNGVLVGNDGALGDHTNWTIKGNILEKFAAYGFELTNASNSSIEGNVIHSDAVFEPNTLIMVDARRNETGITIKNNQIDGPMSPTWGIAAVFIFADSFETPNANLNNVLVEGNTISTTGTKPHLWVYNYAGTGTVTGVQVYNNSLSTLKSNTPAQVDASANWWGTNVAAAVKTAANGGLLVDYTPWLNSGTDTTPGTAGFQGDFSILDVDDDSPQTGVTGRIQEGIDLVSGSTVNVAAGTYNENVVVGKNNTSIIGALAMNANDVPNPAIHTIITSGAPAVTTSPGITINNGITGVTVKNLRVQDFSSNSGIYGVGGNNNLTIDSVHVYSNNTSNAVNGGGIYMNGPVSNVLINNVDSQLNRARGIVIWNGFKQNITITNNYVKSNNCCGIELQDGTASGVTITGNTVISNSDSGIAAIGLTSGAGPNVISNNTVTNNGRFGIEIKMPNGTGAASGDGSIVVENNIVSIPLPGVDLRDFAGIAVIRRAYNVGPGYGYVNIPTGVIVRNNTVSDYRQTNVGSVSTGFGIVAEGTKMKVEGNTLTNNDVGVQVQSGHTPYTGLGGDDGDQSNLADTYFGRGNSPVACVYVPAGSNIYLGNGVDSRNVGTVGSAGITNMDTGAHFCSIQEAIDDATTLNGHTISVPAGTYSEDLTINKSLTLLGPNSAINPNTGTRVAEAVLHPATSNPDPAVCTVMAYLSVSNITIKGFTFDGDNPSLNSGIMIGTADVDACEIIAGWVGLGNIVVENNILKNSTYAGVDLSNYDLPAVPTSGNYIRYNLIKNIGETTYNWGLGVITHYNFYADITDNVFTGVRTGIQTGNFYVANPGATGSISNNQIGVWRLGIFHNATWGSASAFTLANNTITAENYPGATKWNGILLSSIQDAVTATVNGNVISIPVAVSGSRTPTTGYNVWNVTTSAPLTISGGSVTGGQYGVWVNNFEGYASDAGNTSIIVDGLSISGASIAGINVWDSPSNTNSATVTATLNNNVITTSALGVQISGADANSNGTCNQISGNTAGLNNTTTALLTFEKNWWGSVSGPSGTGLGSGDTVSANVDYQPWNTDTTCAAFTSNISPVANAQSVSTAEDTAKAITLTGTDADGGTLTYSVVAGPLHGTLSGTAPALTYTPAANYNGPDSFTFKVNDGTADSNIATVSITITAVNDAPIITEGASINVAMSASTPFSLTLNATDANSDTITWSISTAAGHGTASASGTGTSKSITYTPTLNYIGSDSFVVQVSDGNGGTDTITVNVTITAVEPTPFTLYLPLILR